MPRQKRFKSTKPIDRLIRSAVIAKDYEGVTGQPLGNSEPERITKKWTEGMARHFRERLAQQLKDLREQAGLSLHALAGRAGVDHSQLVRLESAERSCTLETAVKIAGALGVSLGILTDDLPPRS
jgi:ribosome-binding protein aMBF1 (putative translation factor)